LKRIKVLKSTPSEGIEKAPLAGVDFPTAMPAAQPASQFFFLIS
jgi:hypothetical protein